MEQFLEPEMALLADASIPPGVVVRPRQTDAVIDWDRLVELARWHRLSPLLSRHLRRPGAGVSPPGPVVQRLRSDAVDATATSVILAAELDDVLAVLAEADIPAMLLKGSALVEAVYPSAGLRPMNDLDILIPPAAIRRAHRLLEAQGFRAWGVTLGRDDDHRLTTHHDHFPLVGRRGVFVELHRHIVRAGPEFDISGYWVRALPGTGGHPHLLPSPEDLLLHVAVHFAKDRSHRLPAALGQLADLAWICSKWQLDWDALVGRARSYKQGDRLFLALLAMNAVLADITPTRVLHELQPRSYRPAVGRRFVAQRVLRSRPGFPFEELAGGCRRLTPGPEALETFVHRDDLAPSSGRLRLRRAAFIGRRLASSARSPRNLVDDLRLSRWIVIARAEAAEGAQPGPENRASSPGTRRADSEARRR